MVERKCLVALGILLSMSVVIPSLAAEVPVPPADPPVVTPFGVGEVKLLDGPFLNAMKADAAWLLSLDPDRLLSWYRKEAGLEPKGKVYGGWESMGVAGHCLGHYLSACSRLYVETGKKEFLRRVNYIVEELAACQKAGGDGFVGAMPRGREVFAEVSRGEIRSAGFDLNGSWVPWYTLHKELAGLIDAYEYCGNKQALEVAAKLGDWACSITANLTSEQWQKMLACEHGGMNESLAELYRLTGNEAYLELAKKFYHRAILDPLAEERDELAGKHSNTQIPKIIGAAKIATITGDEKFATIARFFWDAIVGSHTYVTGGNSIGEHLGEPGKLNDRLGPNTTETCNTYNMLKLTSALFSQSPEARYTDYAERALWNHILASQDRGTGRVCYFVPLQAGAQKSFMGPEEFACCSGTGMENHVRYCEYIYSRSKDALYVNQFISSELNWEEQGVRVRQLSGLPEEGSIKLEISCQEPKHFSLHVRHPRWAKEGFSLTVNSEPAGTGSDPGSYAVIDRTWKGGDTVEVNLPLTPRTEAMPDNPKRIALFYGPILLAGLIEGDPEGLLPVLVTDNRPVLDWLSKPKDSLRFHTEGVGRPHDLNLAPFFGINSGQYVVYWDLFSESEWQRLKNDYEAERQRIKELEARTVDLFAIGEMQPERDHNVQGENTSAGEHAGIKYRHATDGGWFSFDIKLPEAGPADLVVTYWGSETGPRTFDVLLDGKKLATQSLHQDKPDHFWDRVYQLPEQQTKGKTKATIKFQAHPGNFAGGVFGVRVVRRGPQ